MNDPKENVSTVIKEERKWLNNLASTLWEQPELSLDEHTSAERIATYLENKGFEVKTPIEELPTAFVAEYGSGSPNIGILGEYDALPNMEQTITSKKEPQVKESPGHGCGHNLLGVAGAGAAVTLKESIAQEIVSGSVTYYGCPAEEVLLGKPHMAKAGLFNRADVALTWHPSDITTPFTRSTMAIQSVQFEFQGTSSHAAASPEQGRSALDAVQLLSTGSEYAREHLPSGVKLHYVITEGGSIPNKVPEKATIWYFVRAPDWSQVVEATTWLSDISEGAALMTQTSVSQQTIAASRSFNSNLTLSRVLWENMNSTGELRWSQDEYEFATALRQTFDNGQVQNRRYSLPEHIREEFTDGPLNNKPLEMFDTSWQGAGSTDVGEVSQCLPTAVCHVATWPIGTSFHSWQAVAASKSTGLTGMQYAATVLAKTGVEVLEDDSLLERIYNEFEKPSELDSGSPLDMISEPPESLREISPTITL